MIMKQERERCWPTHRRREPWVLCPLCGAALRWIKLRSEKWTPCDELPVLFVKDGGRTSCVSGRELVVGCSIYSPRLHFQKPRTGRLPHYYSCPILCRERREWAIQQRREERG